MIGVTLRMIKFLLLFGVSLLAYFMLGFFYQRLCDLFPNRFLQFLLFVLLWVLFLVVVAVGLTIANMGGVNLK